MPVAYSVINVLIARVLDLLLTLFFGILVGLSSKTTFVLWGCGGGCQIGRQSGRQDYLECCRLAY